MPDFTTSGVQFPIATDQPRRQAIEDLARSIDDPRGVTYLGKIRNLETTESQTFPSSTNLTRVINWGSATNARQGTDQGDGCGIILGGTDSDIITVSEAGFYWLYANYPWANASGGIRRTALRDPDSGSCYQTNSDSGEAGTGFLGADVSVIVFLVAGQRIVVEAAQNSGGDLAGGNIASRTAWVVAKLRLM